MPLELGLWRIDSTLSQVSHSGLELESRLEEILHSDISILSPNWMVVGRQVRTAYDKLIDLLCIDRDGNLVVIELKRDMTERDTVAQALDYGSWIRSLNDEDIARIFDAYWKKYHPTEGTISINDVFCRRFGFKEMPEELNESHELVVVGSSFDAHTERIVGYLADEYGVRINAVFFRVFKDEGREYLTRFWLREPTMSDSIIPAASRREGEIWNGEYYVSFGHNPTGRNWDDAVNYGFISAGGGSWYTQTLNLLSENSRVWVNVPRIGYVGVGTVVDTAKSIKDFLVESKGKRIPILEAELKSPGIGSNCDDPNLAECLVRVRWLKTLPLAQAISEKGFFGNQNTVARPTTPKWNYTIQRLKERFGVSAS